jgi:Secretion system C-terminal sorting domain
MILFYPQLQLSRGTKRKLLFAGLVVLLHLQVWSQNNRKVTGPLGEYHIAAGYSYTDTLAMPDQAIDNGMDFIPELDSCIAWNANRVVAILQPPTEQGVYNQPADTALYAPYPQHNGPGMIQGAQRFSRLSQLYGGFCGVILDDWAGDTSITRQVRDAVRGKYVDDAGVVHSESVATTPENKLYCVVYHTDSIPGALQVLDGVEFYNVNYQNCCLGRFDSDITTLRANYPGKEIQLGIYLKNSGVGWLQPDGVHYWLAHGLDRYDDGDINGVTLFAGVFLVKDNIPLSIWNGFDLPHWLDSLYYPYLGAGEGNLYDCTTGKPLTDGFVRVYCKGRVSGDTLFRSRQKSDANGQYHFGLWAGNRNTDSTFYWLIAEKPGYVTDTVGFWIKRGDTTFVPTVSLCPTVYSDSVGMETILLFPNPTRGIFTVLTQYGEPVGGQIEIYNMLGQKVYSAFRGYAWQPIDISSQANGVYLVVVRNQQKGFNTKQMLVLQH